MEQTARAAAWWALEAVMVVQGRVVEAPTAEAEVSAARPRATLEEVTAVVVTVAAATAAVVRRRRHHSPPNRRHRARV